MDVTSYRVLFRNSSTDQLLRRPCVSSGGKCNGSRKTWKRLQTRRCGSHDSESISSSLSDDENRNREIKSEADEDATDFPKKNSLSFPDSVTKCQGRMLMREWLEVNANVGCMSGLKWLDKDLGLVQISWKHGSRAGWNRSDVEVFESWALHTGKFNPKKSDCKRWKANFRCALNSLPDVVEIKEKCNTRSRNPYKVYRLLPPHRVTKQSKLKKLRSSDEYILQHLSTCNDETNVSIKEEPVDEENCDLPKLEISHQSESFHSTPPSETKAGEEIPVECAVKMTAHRNLVVDSSEAQETITQQPFIATNSIRHFDHSYANSFEHIIEEQKTDNEVPGISDGHDLMSTINEELAKFCSSSFGVDFWNEEDTGYTSTKFILQDVIDSSDFDGILL